MAVKAVNDTVGPDGLVLTLLVFRAYLRLIEQDALLLTIIKRVETVYLAIKEI